MFAHADQSPAQTKALPTPAELAAHLAARLCHDLISPVSALTSSLGLVDDPAALDMRADAMALVGVSARKLVTLLSFARVAYGAGSSVQPFDPGELEGVTRAVYALARAELDWAVGPEPLARPHGRILLGLAQLGMAILPMGGVARLTANPVDGGTMIALAAQGARARLSPEVAAGLGGEAPGEALPGRWIQAYYLHLLVAEAGGRLEALAEEGTVSVGALLP